MYGYSSALHTVCVRKRKTKKCAAIYQLDVLVSVYKENTHHPLCDEAIK